MLSWPPIRPPKLNTETIEMLPTYRLLNFGLAVIAAAGLFALSTVTPLAQSTQFPSPTSHISDLAGVIDPQTRSRLETLLANLQDKTKIELYVATVDSTGGETIDMFSQRLATTWKVATKTGRSKSLLMVVSAASKSSFTQFSHAAQSQLPDGVLGEMSYRMRSPLSEGRFTDAIDEGVHVFVNALAEKIGFNAAELETSTVATDKLATDTPQTVLVSANDVEKTRPRVVADATKPQDPQPGPPVPSTDTPKSEPTPTETTKPEAAPSETPKPEPSAVETPKPESATTEEPKTESTKPPRRNISAKGATNVTKRTAKTAQLKPTQPTEAEDEEETVALTLVLPVAERIVKLKQFLDTHPDSKERPHAIEYLVSAYAQLGDQKLKSGDTAGGNEQLLHAIDEADSTTSEKLFSGVIAQIPANLYLRGEREAAFKAAQSIETKFGSDPKRLLAIANFYLGIERGDEALRLAESAIKLAPDMAEAHRMRAVGLHITLQLDEAAAEYKRTLELDPASKASRVSLADLYRASGKPELALAIYNEELAADPKDRAARAGKVVSLLELSRLDEANTELDAALKDDAKNLPLLTGAAYWFGAHGNNNKAFVLARQAVGVEPRYTWAQIALARAYLAAKQPLDAERAMRFARQYGKFPTLNYELANVLASMGLYQEAVEVLRQSFALKDGQISTRLASHVVASDTGFIELLAPERRAGIFQTASPDTPENARILKALLAFNSAITAADGEKINESAAVEAAQEFAAGTDAMRAFRQLYAASRLLRNSIGIPAALELVTAARKASDDALNTPVLTMAVQADEFRDLRARAITAGNVPDVSEAPRTVLANILKGRIEDLEGWALFNQEKYPDAIEHLKKAAEVLPASTPAWRSALWHLGAALEQTGQKEQALDFYIKSYQGGEEDNIRRSVIEQLYRKVNGSADGLEARLSGVATEPPKAEPVASPTESPAAPAQSSSMSSSEPVILKPEPVILKPEPSPTPTEAAQPEAKPAETSPAMSDESLRNAASRLRSTIKIAGRIVDANKAPLANVVVVLISPSGSVIASTTNSDGVYSFTVAPSQKTYRVIPSKDGYSFTPLDKSFAALIEDQRDVDFVGVKP
jgi:tetratricopeptide (TPR) repeat protein